MLSCVTGREVGARHVPSKILALIASARDMARLDRPEGRLVKVHAVNLEEEEPGWAGGERVLTVYASYTLWRTLVSPLRGTVLEYSPCVGVCANRYYNRYLLPVGPSSAVAQVTVH